MKATDSTNHQTPAPDYKTQFDNSQIVTMKVSYCSPSTNFLNLRSADESYNNTKRVQAFDKRGATQHILAAAWQKPLEKLRFTLPSNIKMLKVVPQDIVSFGLGIDPNNSVEVIEVYNKYDYPSPFKQRAGDHGCLEYLPNFIQNYTPNVKVLYFAKMPYYNIKTYTRDMRENMIRIFPQLDIIDLSELQLTYKIKPCYLKPAYSLYDYLFLAWRLIKGNLKDIITNEAKLTDAQAFLKNADHLSINQILAKLPEVYYKDLFQLMEETFQIGLWRNIIKKLDQNLTLIEADPNSSKFKKLPIDLNKQLVKAISILPAKDISFLTISSLSKTKIPLSWFLSNTKIENTQITNLNNEPSQFAAFVRNMLLANVFDGNAIKSTSVAHKKQLELFNKLKKTGPVYKSLQKYLQQSDWLSYIDCLKTKQQDEVRQMFQPQDEEISQQVAGDRNCLYSSVANGLRKFGLTISPAELKRQVIEFGKKHAPSNIAYMQQYEIKFDHYYKRVTKTEYFNHHAKASEWDDNTIIIETIAQYLGKNICIINQYGYTSFAFRINNSNEAILLYHSGNHFENINTLFDCTLLDSLQALWTRQETNDIWDKEHQYKWAQDNNNLQEAAKYYIQNNYDDPIEPQLKMSGETTSATLP